MHVHVFQQWALIRYCWLLLVWEKLWAKIVFVSLESELNQTESISNCCLWLFDLILTLPHRWLHFSFWINISGCRFVFLVMSVSYQSLANFIVEDNLSGLGDYLDNNYLGIDDRNDVSCKSFQLIPKPQWQYLWKIELVAWFVIEWINGVITGGKQRQSCHCNGTAQPRQRSQCWRRSNLFISHYNG